MPAKKRTSETEQDGSSVSKKKKRTKVKSGDDVATEMMTEELENPALGAEEEESGDEVRRARCERRGAQLGE